MDFVAPRGDKCSCFVARELPPYQVVGFRLTALPLPLPAPLRGWEGRNWDLETGGGTGTVPPPVSKPLVPPSSVREPVGARRTYRPGARLAQARSSGKGSLVREPRFVGRDGLPRQAQVRAGADSVCRGRHFIPRSHIARLRTGGGDWRPGDKRGNRDGSPAYPQNLTLLPFPARGNGREDTIYRGRQFVPRAPRDGRPGEGDDSP